MITSLTLKNFRNFKERSFHFELEKTFIIWENGIWKTNILEALSLLTHNSITWIDFEKLVNNWEEVFFISCDDDEWNTVSISFDQKEKKKTYIINGKKTSKRKLWEVFTKSVTFSPIIMNLMYLSPSLRRDFIDNILTNSYPEYEKLLKEYKKILKHRNKLLKNIRENKSSRDEIIFWNTQFIEKACELYQFRFIIVWFLEKHIKSAKEYFRGKIDDISFIYQHKIQKDDREGSIKKYLDENFERDIILGNTHIGPHIDDFDIEVNSVKLIDFASRWETKSIIIWLKLLETAFIENITKKKPILLIDDLLSELDEDHKLMLVNKIKYYQTFITSIELKTQEDNLIKL